jgi:DNA-directed RNA polymerase subunit RPC12/RpoP
MGRIENLGEAMDLGWRVHARCLWTGHEGLKRTRDCGWRMVLDLPTLVATRGRAFPIADLASRLRCPRCGGRRLAVAFEPTADDNRRFAGAGGRMK